MNLFWALLLGALGCRAQRLPDTLTPFSYKLDIVANLGDEDDKFEFHGTVWIKVKCLKETTNITLHSKNLDVKDAKVQHLSDKSKPPIVPASVKLDAKEDLLTLILPEKLQKDDEYEVHINFKGKLEDGLAGFYRSSYEDQKTHEKVYLATTQFEATDARRAFPCFDEPAFKATFQISIGHAEKYNAISNMPQTSVQPMKNREGWVRTFFKKTVPMSTYLVAFIVSNLQYETSPETPGNNVTFKIWAREDAIDQVEFATEIGPKFLRYYEDFFDVKYPLPKQDMVAIPDFNAGAMENWGLITYRETYLLYDPQVSATTNKESIASVIAHELAHQWFGNLVTMKWWTDLWLNEGFATYMAAIAVHHLFPEWNSLDDDVAGNLLNVFSFDSLISSHPVSVKVHHPREIDEIFDTIAYKKGSSILRMMSLFLGEHTLRKGLTKYLEAHKYGNAEQDDLWEKLTEQAHSDNTLPKNLTVKQVMDTWTLRTGFPVVNVERNYNDKTADLRQTRFLRDVIKKKSSTDKDCWWVPITYTDENQLEFNSTQPKHWLSCSDSGKNQEKLEHLPEKDKWIIVNIQASGVYRVNYDEKNWRMLADYMNNGNFEKIPVLNRVLLIDDASSLAWTGDLNYEIFFDLVRYLKDDKNYLTWRAALKSIWSLDMQLKKTSAYGKFKRYMRRVIAPAYRQVNGLNVTNDSQQNSLEMIKQRKQIVTWACKVNVGDCKDETKAKFNEYHKNPEETDIIPKDLRYLVYCHALKQGDEREWNFLWKQYLASNVATEKSTILQALGCTQELWLLNRYLNWTLDPDSGIRKQDYSRVFTSVADNDLGYYIAKDFLEQNFDMIHKSLEPNTKRLTNYLSGIAARMNTEPEYSWFKKFTSDRKEKLETSKQGVNQSLEKIQLNIQWQQQHLSEIRTILEDFDKKATI